MFGRRRHAAAALAVEAASPMVFTPPQLVHAPPAVIAAPELSDERLFEVVHTQLDALLGANGLWAVVPRGAGDSDAIFQSVLTRSFAVGVTDAIREAKRQLDEPAAPVATVDAPREPSAAEIALAQPPVQDELQEPIAASVEAESEPAAFRWEPAPITVWTDLKKPVTGPLAQIAPPSLVA